MIFFDNAIMKKFLILRIVTGKKHRQIKLSTFKNYEY